MAEISVVIERELETDAGWEHRVRITQGASATSHVLRMGFSDYEHWCRGVVAPGEMARRVVELLVQDGDPRVPWPLPEVIDAGKVRRWVPGADEALGGGGV